MTGMCTRTLKGGACDSRLRIRNSSSVRGLVVTIIRLRGPTRRKAAQRKSWVAVLRMDTEARNGETGTDGRRRMAQGPAGLKPSTYR